MLDVQGNVSILMRLTILPEYARGRGSTSRED